MKGFLKGIKGGIVDYPSEPDSQEVKEAKARWKASSNEYTSLKKILDRVARHMDQVAEDLTVLADHLSTMSGNAKGARITILSSMAEAERAVGNNLWRLIPTIDDELIAALNTALEGKPEELTASKEEYRRRKKEMAKGRRKKPQDGEEPVDMTALESAADVASQDLVRMLDNVREERAVSVTQAVYSALAAHAFLTASANQTLQECKGVASEAAQTLGLRDAPLPGGEISGPTDVKHVGGAGLSQLHNTNNFDLSDGKGAKLGKEMALDMAFPTRVAKDDKLKAGAKGNGSASPPSSNSSSDEEAAPPPPPSTTDPTPPLSSLAPSFPRIPAPSPPATLVSLADAPPRPPGPPPSSQSPPTSSASPPADRPAGPPPPRPPPARPPPLPSNPPPAGGRKAGADHVGLASVLAGGAAQGGRGDGEEGAAGGGREEEGGGREEREEKEEREAAAARERRANVVSTTSTFLVQGEEGEGAERVPSYQREVLAEEEGEEEGGGEEERAAAGAGGGERGEEGGEGRGEGGEDGWEAFRDDDGTVYFHNSVTGQTQWERPEGFDGEPESSDDEE